MGTILHTSTAESDMSQAPTDANILLVEDDPATARVMTRLMQSVGVNVEAVGTVKEGIAALARVPDVVVLDLMLPDGLGVEVLEAARAAKLRCKVGVVTANTNPEVFQRLRSAGPDAIFSKPLDFEDFVQWLCESFPESGDTGLAA
jgi:CheY-like chemotaxis protein